jgi:prolyl oligopeptidase
MRDAIGLQWPVGRSHGYGRERNRNVRSHALPCSHKVPLLDMRRYHKLLAGASWMAEYGDPDVPSDWAFLRHHSPYERLRSNDCLGLARSGSGSGGSAADSHQSSGWRSPRVLFTTSTRDDRVHPGHARKMVKVLRG